MAFTPPVSLRDVPNATEGKAIIVPDKYDITYEDLKVLISITATYLRKNYVSKKETETVISCAIINSAEFVSSFLGIAWSGR